MSWLAARSLVRCSMVACVLLTLVSARSERTETWWSLRPLVQPTPPTLRAEDTAWARTPIDAFILASLRARGLAPSPEADRRTLIRRVYFDLVGLPPTPEAVEAFVRDESPDSYERLVDQLLASPRYGERWARHWMDVVHYAETHGHDQDRIRENAWRYRDYLIDAFNRDTPYATFVREQLAADVFFPDKPELTSALGMVAAGPWDESSLRDIREDVIDRQVGYYLDRDDMVATVMSTFTSSTVHCARCHDHKFDPITQEDYYSLQAVFAGVGRANRAYDADLATRAKRAALTSQREALERRDPATMATLSTADVQQRVDAFEKELAYRPVKWTTLDPATFVSEGGATLTKQADFSVLSGGDRPEKDTLVLTAPSPLDKVTAVRIEVLTDDSLPLKGPGRQENGNLHLSEFSVGVLNESGGTAKPQAATIARAFADFDQQGWTIQHSIDGNVATAWGIYPQVSKAHEAAFELKDALVNMKGRSLVFTLAQLHGGHHLIGRVRLSATDAPPPIQPSQLPGDIAAILATPRDQRNDEQRHTLARHVVLTELTRGLESLPAEQYVYAIAADFKPDGGHKPPTAPRPVHVLERGDIQRPGNLASPGALSCVTTLPARFDIVSDANESARRAALADWLVDPRNPLTWRSIVNRVWHYHFGRGIVETPNDLGRMGAKPSHPELLDWLAADFLKQRGSLKQLHRLIVTSAAYRQSSQHRADCAAVDVDNHLLWRMNRHRLEAESVHDAVLQVSGRIDLTMGGPSVRQFALSPGVHVTPVVDYTKYDWNSPGSGRRSVYRFVFRTLPDPFLDSLDCADASQLTAKRNVSITPLAALSMLNNAFILTSSEHLAQRLTKEAGNVDEQIALAYALALGRPPTAEEMSDWRGYIARRGLANFCRMLLNSNDFVFVD